MIMMAGAMTPWRVCTVTLVSLRTTAECPLSGGVGLWGGYL